MQAARTHCLGSPYRARPTTASSSTIVTSWSLSTRRHGLPQHEGIAHESRSKAGLGERRGSKDARSRCTWRTSTRTEAGELTCLRASRPACPPSGHSLLSRCLGTPRIVTRPIPTNHLCRSGFFFDQPKHTKFRTRRLPPSPTPYSSLVCIVVVKCTSAKRRGRKAPLLATFSSGQKS